VLSLVPKSAWQACFSACVYAALFANAHPSHAQVEGPAGIEAVGAVEAKEDHCGFMQLSSRNVYPGQKDVEVHIVISHECVYPERVVGFQFSGVYEPDVIQITSIHKSSFYEEFFDADFDVFAASFPEGTRLFWGASLLFKTDPDGGVFGNYFIPPNTQFSFVTMTLDVTETAEVGTISAINPRELTCEDRDPCFAGGSFNNILVFQLLENVTRRTTHFRRLRPAFIRVFDEHEFFTRGDVDGDETVSETDALRIFGYLFAATSLDNLDAADVDDSGLVTPLDGIRLLQYLYHGGEAPSPPFDRPDIDPTGDDLR